MTTPQDEFLALDSVRATVARLALLAGVRELRVAHRLGDRATEWALSTRATSMLGAFVPLLAAQGFAPTSDRPADVINALGSFTQRGPLEAGYSTVANAVGTVGQMLVEQGYDGSAGVANMIAAPRTVSTFQPFTAYRLQQGGTFAKVPPGRGAADAVSLLSSGAVAGRVETYGVELGVTRQDLLNDDVGAFAAAFADIGHRAALAVERALFAEAVMEASDSFYASGNGNRATSSALSASTLGAVEALIWAQAGDDGVPVGARPATLLVPPALSHTARALLQGQGQGSNNQLRVAVSPFLSATGFPDAAATTWHLVGDPVAMAAFFVVDLAGRRMPTVTTMPAEGNFLGTRVLITHDFAVTRGNHRSAAKASA